MNTYGLSQKKLSNLRSGQTVWRVWGYPRKDGNGVEVSAARYIILGKKTKPPGHCGSIKMVCKRPGPSFMDTAKWECRENRAGFLSDLQGIACFPTEHRAKRFAEEVNSGLYPEITEWLFWYHRDIDVWNGYIDIDDFEYEEMTDGRGGKSDIF